MRRLDPELKNIEKDLQRLRHDLERDIQQFETTRSTTSELLGKIQELRERMRQTQQLDAKTMSTRQR